MYSGNFSLSKKTNQRLHFQSLYSKRGRSALLYFPSTTFDEYLLCTLSQHSSEILDSHQVGWLSTFCPWSQVIDIPLLKTVVGHSDLLPGYGSTFEVELKSDHSGVCLSRPVRPGSKDFVSLHFIIYP